MSGARPRRWVVAGGGTGGHVTPALAVAERIAARGDDVLVMGSRRGLENQLVPAAGFPLVALPSQQLMGRSGAARLLAAPAMARACVSAWRALARARAEIVVSVGGYASVPAVVAAARRGLPIALVEPNAVAGRANRLAARFARRVFVGFAATASAFPRQAAAGTLREVGIPLRSELVRAFSAVPARRDPQPPFRLLVFGGSQGARQINELMMQAAPSLAAGRVEVFHQTGEADRQRVERAYASAGVRGQVVAFEPHMPERYRWADLALSRAGALTVAELAMAGLPALLVPYPYAADDHQRANARALAEAGAALVLEASSLAPEAVAQAIGGLFEKPGELAAMGRAAARMARPDAAERIVSECASLLAREGD